MNWPARDNCNTLYVKVAMVMTKQTIVTRRFSLLFSL